MVLTPNDFQRLASLTALGAGVLAVGVPAANASIIVVSPNVTVGSSNNSQYLFNFPGNAGMRLNRGGTGSSSVQVRLSQTSGYVLIGSAGGGRIQAFPAGGTWGGTNTATSGNRVAWKDSFGGAQTDFDSTNRYFLFIFRDTSAGNALRYGWGELTVAFNPNPQVNLLRWAYDDSGDIIEAGDQGAAAVPEPSSFVLTGLGALALGARGVRRWRAARNQAA